MDMKEILDDLGYDLDMVTFWIVLLLLDACRPMRFTEVFDTHSGPRLR